MACYVSANFQHTMSLADQLLKITSDRPDGEDNLLILLLRGGEELEAAFEPEQPPEPRASKRLVTRLLER